ncbi:MAG: helix-turn-helix domain-containing protein [Acidobacteria bacterium]|nr:helix-turn-helix domain-containing protein [Acidobacteriota bacterium]MBP7474200.1 helix-turn-helix domain-containing protein [Pyrinomonadaceae bacterium]
MDNPDFVLRLIRTFDGATMAVVARRLGIPHATVRNYYKEGRLPAPDVLIKIANVTGVSLNWLLLGRGEMFAGELPPLDLGRLLEGKIGEIVDRRLAAISIPVDELGAIDTLPEFDVESAVRRYHDPQTVLNEWFTYEGRNIPHDYGVVFFRGWGSFTEEEKIAAIRDAKRVLDRSLDR